MTMVNEEQKREEKRLKQIEYRRENKEYLNTKRREKYAKSISEEQKRINREKAKTHYSKNSDTIKEKRLRYYYENHEKAKEIKRAHYQKNRETITEKQRAYNKKNTVIETMKSVYRRKLKRITNESEMIAVTVAMSFSSGNTKTFRERVEYAKSREIFRQ